MEQGVDLILEQKQTVKLTPAQLQTIEILQMNSLELAERVHEELLENPVLEEGVREYEEGENLNTEDLRSQILDAYADAYDEDERTYETGRPQDTYYINDNGSGGIHEFEKFFHSEITLHDHLLRQLAGVKCSEDVRKTAEFIIYSLDGDGYLDTEESEIAEVSESSNETVRDALSIVRDMDPVGIGYYSLAECLISQLNPDDEMFEDAKRVIENSLPDVASGNSTAIAATYEIRKSRAESIIRIIRNLEPKPGMRFSDGKAVQYIVPDVMVDIINGEPHIYMSKDQPHLTMSQYYSNLAKTSDDKEVLTYLKDKIERARHLIDNIENRSRTIELVTKAILDRQTQFLEKGNKMLMPLTMQEIADDLDLHVSTVSRAVNGKYMQCPGGTYSLKHFFTTDVSGMSRDTIVDKIKALVAGEDPAKPLSDQKIADILQADGIDVSRRTVAKYRDAEGILPTNLRKTR